MVTQDEIIDALNWVGCSSSPMVRQSLANRIKAEGIAPPDGFALVPIYDCFWCSNTGTTSHKGTTTLSPHCFCTGMPQSRYNQNKAMLAAAQKENARG